MVHSNTPHKRGILFKRYAMTLVRVNNSDRKINELSHYSSKDSI